MSRRRRRKCKATAISLLILLSFGAFLFFLPIGLMFVADFIRSLLGYQRPMEFDLLVIVIFMFGVCADLPILIYGLCRIASFWVRLTAPYGYTQCAKCGYDLRGTRRQSCVCPECGVRNEPYLEPEEMLERFGRG